MCHRSTDIYIMMPMARLNSPFGNRMHNWLDQSYAVIALLNLWGTALLLLGIQGEYMIPYGHARATMLPACQR